MSTVYYLCINEHIFSTKHCPFDGWENPHFLKISETITLINKNNELITIEALINNGLPKEITKRTLIIDFGNKERIFEGLWPKEYSYYKSEEEIKEEIKALFTQNNHNPPKIEM